MSFHIDMSELNNAHARYLSMSEEVRNKEFRVWIGLLKVIRSMSEVGQAVANELIIFTKSLI